MPTVSKKHQINSIPLRESISTLDVCNLMSWCLVTLLTMNSFECSCTIWVPWCEWSFHCLVNASMMGHSEGSSCMLPSHQFTKQSNATQVGILLHLPLLDLHKSRSLSSLWMNGWAWYQALQTGMNHVTKRLIRAAVHLLLRSSAERHFSLTMIFI